MRENGAGWHGDGSIIIYAAQTVRLACARSAAARHLDGRADGACSGARAANAQFILKRLMDGGYIDWHAGEGRGHRSVSSCGAIMERSHWRPSGELG
ncbi:SgrR family transcriptional regulator [Paenibacillus xanthanilyticus]|uniref:SgrR family transcriptional regulator n=1 Tax=Paenibacillus xanthanilyticus TaxID=1783531 RepID=UPI00363F3DE3